MLFDDFMMRQIRKIADLVAAIAASSSGLDLGDIEERIAEAYRSLGLDRSMVFTFDGASLARMAGDPEAGRALVDLMVAHAQAREVAGDLPAATALLRRAGEALGQLPRDPAREDEDDDRRATVEARLAALAAG